MSAVTDVSGVVLKFTDNRNARLGLSAFVLASLVVLAMMGIPSINYDADAGLRIALTDNQKLAFVVIFGVLFACSRFILYLLSAKDATDVYSEVREAITGAWVVSYEAAVGPRTHSARPKQNTYCKIDINPEKNYSLHSKTKGVNSLSLARRQFVRSPYDTVRTADIICSITAKWNDNWLHRWQV